jgi:hypothetical protein
VIGALATRYTRWSAAALAGDLVVFAMFPFLGSAEHGFRVDSESFVRVFVPFAVAWAVVGLLSTSFASATVASVRRTAVVVPVAWLIAGVLGIAIRINAFDRGFVLSFSIVAIWATLVMLSMWRLALAWALGRARASADPVTDSQQEGI